MNRLVYAAGLSVLVAACASLHNPDAGDPEVAHATSRSVQDVIACMTDNARKHDAPIKSMPLPQGITLDFGDSNIVKVRSDEGQTYYRFYPGKRHVSNLWIEAAGKTCAP
jgi:hypothetical protein